MSVTPGPVKAIDTIRERLIGNPIAWIRFALSTEYPSSRFIARWDRGKGAWLSHLITRHYHFAWCSFGAVGGFRAAARQANFNYRLNEKNNEINFTPRSTDKRYYWRRLILDNMPGY